MPRFPIPFPLRRAGNRLLGRGPWRLAPFDLLRQDSLRDSLHRPEEFSGVIRTVADQRPAFFAAPHSLLGQAAELPTFAGEPRYHTAGLAPSPAIRLCALADAGLAGDEGVVYCPRSRRAVLETVRAWRLPPERHPLLGAPGLPPAKPLPGLSLSLAGLSAQGFYHHLYEMTPRLWIARDLLPRVDHILLSGPPDPVRQAWLEAAGVSAEKLRWLGGLDHHRCEQLLFTDPVIADCRPTPWLRDALRGLFSVPTPSASARRWLWISRADASSRHLAWEETLLARFPRFEKVLLSRLPPARQIALASEAAVIAGPHGAGLATALFAPPGLRLVELFPDLRLKPLFSRVASLVEGRASWAAVDFERPSQLEPLAVALAKELADLP